MPPSPCGNHERVRSTETPRRSTTGRRFTMTRAQLAPEAQRIHELSANRPSVTTLTPDEAREQSRARRLLINRPIEQVAQVTDLTIDGPGGPLTLRRYDPSTDSAPLPAIVFLHGGGWVIGDLDGHDPLCRQLANRVGAIVFSVD